MTSGRPLPLAGALLLIAPLLLADGAAAQSVSGMALGPDGEPAAGVPIALHRVGGAGGATVASAVTDDAGRFRLEIEMGDSALYFGAMRYEGRMYIGPALRGADEDIAGYTIRADPSMEAGNVAGALSGSRAPPAAAPPTGRGAPGDSAAVWLVSLLALATAAAFVATAPGYRRRRTREALIELASLENRLEGTPDADPDRGAIAAERDRLRERLSPRA